MSFFSVTPWEHYGYRKSRSLGTPVQHIGVIAKAKPGRVEGEIYQWTKRGFDGLRAYENDRGTLGRSGSVHQRRAAPPSFARCRWSTRDFHHRLGPDEVVEVGAGDRVRLE